MHSCRRAGERRASIRVSGSGTARSRIQGFRSPGSRDRNAPAEATARARSRRRRAVASPRITISGTGAAPARRRAFHSLARGKSARHPAARRLCGSGRACLNRPHVHRLSPLPLSGGHRSARPARADALSALRRRARGFRANGSVAAHGRRRRSRTQPRAPVAPRRGFRQTRACRIRSGRIGGDRVRRSQPCRSGAFRITATGDIPRCRGTDRDRRGHARDRGIGDGRGR